MSRTKFVYLLHFDRPYKHARHYIGSAQKLAPRMIEHGRGQGARLLAVVAAAGITWQLAAVSKGGRVEERALKNRRDACALCPLCRTEKLRRKAEQQQARRQRKYLAAINANLPPRANLQLFA